MSIFLIAEAGVNHNGRWERGLDLIDAAKRAGADAVKFQMFSSQRLFGDNRIAHLEFHENDITAMHAHCAEVGIEFMCTPFGVPEVDFLKPLVKRFKIASGCLAKPALLEAVRDTGLPVILSTGMSTLPDIDMALINLFFHWPDRYRQDFTLLHCTSAYPCPDAQANLAAMDTLRRLYGMRAKIGYSDHTEGICIALAAAARGAEVIEKHLTMDREQIGPDHKASIEPDTFASMVRDIRRIEQAIGDGRKGVQPSEAATREAWYG